MKQLRARADFETARIQAFLRDAGSVLRGDTRPLLSFDEVRRAARLEEQSYRGLKDVPIADIRGSVGRPNDFDASFLPVKPQMRKRWEQLDAAMRGWKTIPARVIEVRTRAPLSGDMDAAALLQAKEYVDFLERSQLDRIRPEASIAVSRLGRYDRIFEDILGHRYFMGLQQYREVGIAEASASWYDNVYKPIADLIREYDILAHFPGRTEADLYIWITARWLELSRAQKPAGPAEAIADILFEKEGAGTPPPSPQVLAVLQRWLGPPRRVIEIPVRLIRAATTLSGEPQPPLEPV